MSGGSDTNIKETPVQAQQASIARQQWEDYRTRWRPVQDYFIRRTQNNDALRQQAEGGTNAATQIAFDKAGGALDNTLANTGAGLGSGRAVMAKSGLAASKSASLRQVFVLWVPAPAPYSL